MTRKMRLGFVGLGWIGRHRMEAMLATGVADAVGFVDPSDENAAAAAVLVPDAARLGSIEALLALEPDGVVIATPSALHAAQSIAALERGAAVFCQKPLGRTAAEVGAVIEAARRADRLLEVDLSYRRTAAMQAIRALVREGGLGQVFAADLVFHNAYGPDKPWFYDPALAGGGCVMDLGVHLVDLALWVLGFPEVDAVSSVLHAKGAPLAPGRGEVEDHAVAALTLSGGVVVRIACSWRLHAGRDAEIGAAFHGTEGGAAMRNLDGSFYDLAAHRFRGTRRKTLAMPPDAWGGRAAAAWATRLAVDARYDPEAERLVDVARVLDRIYR